MDLTRNPLTQQELDNLQIKANKSRGSILKMTTLSASGHPGGSMSTIDFLTVLYELIDVNPEWHEDRDKVVVSNGHISPAVYSVLAANGFFDIDDAIAQFRLARSIFEGHIEPDVPGVEWATGNLGQGLSAACGFALASRLNKHNNHMFVIMGDGEQQKGQISEARRFATKYSLNNITVFIDYNKLQIGGNIDSVMPQDIKANFESDGWHVIDIDAHNMAIIQDAIFEAVKIDKPVMILGHTVMGNGVSFMENKEKYHGSTLSEEQLNDALQELGIDNDLEKYKEARNNFKPIVRDEHKILAKPIITGKPIVYSSKTDNRSAWGTAVADLAKLNKKDCSLAVFDCDLKGSVKVNDFEAEASENFFEVGIMEHHAATMAGAMSKCGYQTYFADFGVFGVDETYNQHRLNDINLTNIKVITTHVGLDVGEDGKTHQCIDYIGVMKNLYNFNIAIPADPNQTDSIVRQISTEYANYIVPMGRSKLDIIKKKDGSIFFDENYKFVYGKSDKFRDGDKAALFVTGTLANRAVEVADRLAEDGIDIKVFNISCPKSLDEDALIEAVSTGIIFTYEDHNVNTGLGNCVADKLMEMQKFCKLYKFGVEGYALSGKSSDVFKHCKLDVDNIIKRIKERI